MSFLNRKMFANGGSALASNEVLVGDQSYTFDIAKLEQAIREGTLDGMNLYPILNAPGAQRGSEIQRILNTFKKGDEPGVMPAKLAANFMEIPEEERAGTIYAPGDFGSGLQNIGLQAQRAGQSVRNVGAYLGNRAAQGYGIAADAITSPRMRGLLGGPDAEIKKQEEIDAGFSYAPEEDLFGYTPLMTKDDVARIRLNQMGDLITSRDTIEQELGDLNVVDTATVEEVPVDPKKVVEVLNPNTGTVEIKNLTEEEYQEMEAARIRKQMEDRDIGFSQNPEIEDLLDEIKPAESKVDVDKTEADSLLDTEEKFAGLSEEELKKEIEPDLISLEDLTTGDDDTSTPAPIVTETSDPINRKLDEPGFFGSDRFLDFIRNVGGELSRTGQMGQGLSLGAAKAAEERAARELMADQEERDFASKLRLAKAEAALAGLEGPDSSMKKELRKVGQEMNADYNDIVSSNNTLEIVARVEEIVNNEDTTSAKAFLGELLEKGAALFNIDGAVSETGKSFDDLEPRTRAKVLLNQIKQKNIRDILGESGKTISNLDRQIVEELVGSIAAGNTPQEILEALRLTKESIFNNLNSAQNRLKTNDFFAQNEGGMYLISENKTIIDYLKTGILPSTLYNDAFESQSVRKITLEEEE